MTLNETVPNRVRAIRERRGMSVSELSRRVQVARQTIYNIEDGDPSSKIGVMRRIAEALDVPLEDLFETAVVA